MAIKAMVNNLGEKKPAYMSLWSDYWGEHKVVGLVSC